MGPGKRLREAVVVAVTLLFAIIALRMSAKNPGDLSALDRGILHLVSPAQSAMSFIARAITGVAGHYVELTHVRGENEALTRENQKLRAELTEMRRLAEESGRYQRLLGLRDVKPAETIAARVIAVDASPYFRVARVDIDHGEGAVRHGMPVLTPDGVVGRVNRVSGKSSDILLLVDPRSAIDVVIPRTGGRGILRGKAAENGYRCNIEYLARGEPAKEGDAVVTSGLGSAFPRNLAVGHITRVIPGAVGLYQDVEVTPDVDFARLSEVLVVVAPPPAPDTDPAALVRALPAKLGFDLGDIEIRNVEVLLVMPHGAQTRFVERELQQCGYRVSLMADSLRAFAMVVETKPDLVIISAMMPDLEGIDLAMALSAMPSTRNIPLAVITSLDKDDDILKLLPKRIPVLFKGSSFADDLFKALDNLFLI